MSRQHKIKFVKYTVMYKIPKMYIVRVQNLCQYRIFTDNIYGIQMFVDVSCYHIVLVVRRYRYTQRNVTYLTIFHPLSLEKNACNQSDVSYLV